MKLPKLDPRSQEDLRNEILRLARSYTPEWRLERTAEDPGAALAELFCQMHYETVERLNALPEKLYLEFLNEIGFREPNASPSEGIMRFSPHPTLEEPVRVPSGTQVFTTDEDGENVVFETTRMFEATTAELRELYYVDGERDEIRRIADFSTPRSLFDPNEGESVQQHRFYIGENDVLRLDCPAAITLRLVPPAAYMQQEAAESLTGKGMKWFYLQDGEEVPFDAVRVENSCVVLEKRSRTEIGTPRTAGGEDEETGGGLIRCLGCAGRTEQQLLFDRVDLYSTPLEPCLAQTAFSGDIPISPTLGGACFSRRPAPYEMLYLRCDTALSKKGAGAILRLELGVVVDEPEKEDVEYEYGPDVIQLEPPASRKLDDVFVSGVLWEYYNGLGWRELPVTGDTNPFTGTAGTYALRFVVPKDLEEVEVNAQPGLYLRARVTDMEHMESLNQRWLIPYLLGAAFEWSYTSSVPSASWLYAENNGEVFERVDCTGDAHLNFPAFSTLQPDDRAVYLRFDGSPHAMPLSLRFLLRSGPRMEKLLWEAWNGNAFVPVQCLDETENLSRSGEMFLYLDEPLPERKLFGQTGCWLRLSRTSERESRTPTVLGIEQNVVNAVQNSREPEQLFDTGIFEINKEIQLLSSPVQQCEVWVDEMSRLSDTEALAMAEAGGDSVRLEMDGHRVLRCWVRWNQAGDMALTGADARVYELSSYEGSIRFGDGVRGMVPPEGDHNIRVTYSTGGGRRGNVPTGEVTELLAGLPRISTTANLTAMTGGTDRWSLDRIETLGNRRLRHQGRAASIQDYEDIVLELFPRVRHVRCFSGRDAEGRVARGEVLVVLCGFGERGESIDRLCQKVKAELSRRCSCCLVAENRLHVIPAQEITVSTTILIEVEQLDYAAQTQQEIVERIERLIGKTWQNRPIGEQLSIQEIWSAVREARNVRLIRRVLADGSFDENGVRRLVPLEDDSSFPYAVVRNGSHVVKLV